MLSYDSIKCPVCGETLEFEFDEDDEAEDDGACCCGKKIEKKDEE